MEILIETKLLLSVDLVHTPAETKFLDKEYIPVKIKWLDLRDLNLKRNDVWCDYRLDPIKFCRSPKKENAARALYNIALACWWRQFWKLTPSIQQVVDAANELAEKVHNHQSLFPQWNRRELWVRMNEWLVKYIFNIVYFIPFLVTVLYSTVLYWRFIHSITCIPSRDYSCLLYFLEIILNFV